MDARGYTAINFAETRSPYYQYDLLRYGILVGRTRDFHLTFVSPAEENKFLEFVYDLAPDQVVGDKDRMMTTMANLIAAVVYDPVRCLTKCELTTFVHCDWQTFYDKMYT